MAAFEKVPCECFIEVVQDIGYLTPCPMHEAAPQLLAAAKAALVAQELRTRVIMEHIAAEYAEIDPLPPVHHTLPGEEEAEKLLKAAITAAEPEGPE